MRWSKDQTVVDGDLSVEAISPLFEYDTQRAAQLQISWTGTPNGTFYVQSTLNKINFPIVTGASRVVDSMEGDGSHTIVFDQLGDFYLRVHWVPGMGSTGLVQIWQGGKGV